MLANHSRMTDLIRDYLSEAHSTVESLALDQIERVIDELNQAYEHGRQVLIFGNGGSAATASHFACDLAKTILGRSVHADAKRFKVLCLSDNMPLITAWGNDFSFERVFAEQLRTFAQ